MPAPDDRPVLFFPAEQSFRDWLEPNPVAVDRFAKGETPVGDR